MGSLITIMKILCLVSAVVLILAPVSQSSSDTLGTWWPGSQISWWTDVQYKKYKRCSKKECRGKKTSACNGYQDCTVFEKVEKDCKGWGEVIKNGRYFQCCRSKYCHKGVAGGEMRNGKIG